MRPDPARTLSLLSWLNAGTGVPLSIDIDGDPRPYGAYDIGADEFTPKIFLPLVSGPAGDA